MTGFVYNNRWLRLAKDILLLVLSGWLVSRSNILAVVLGLLGFFWYGRDIYYQAKVLWQEKHYKEPGKQQDIKTGAPKDDKITLTADAKEVDFRKE